MHPLGSQPKKAAKAVAPSKPDLRNRLLRVQTIAHAQCGENPRVNSAPSRTAHRSGFCFHKKKRAVSAPLLRNNESTGKTKRGARRRHASKHVFCPSEGHHGVEAQSTSFRICRYGIVHFRVLGQRISLRHRLWRTRWPRFGSWRAGVHPRHKRHRACGLFSGKSNGSRKASKHSCRRVGNHFSATPYRNPANPKCQRLAVAGMFVVLDLGYAGKRHLFFRCPNPLCQQLSFPPGGRLVCRRLVSSILLHSLAPNSIVEAAIIGASIIVLGFALAARRNVLHVTPR